MELENDKQNRGIGALLRFLVEGLGYQKPMRKLGRLRCKGWSTRARARRRVRNRMQRESRRINFARARAT